MLKVGAVLLFEVYRDDDNRRIEKVDGRLVTHMEHDDNYCWTVKLEDNTVIHTDDKMNITSIGKGISNTIGTYVDEDTTTYISVSESNPFKVGDRVSILGLDSDYLPVMVGGKYVELLRYYPEGIKVYLLDGRVLLLDNEYTIIEILHKLKVDVDLAEDSENNYKQSPRMKIENEVKDESDAVTGISDTVKKSGSGLTKAADEFIDRLRRLTRFRDSILYREPLPTEEVDITSSDGESSSVAKWFNDWREYINNSKDHKSVCGSRPDDESDREENHDVSSDEPCDVESVDPFNDILDELYNIYTRKNHDYGNSTTATYNKFGMTSYAVRLTDKVSRLSTLCKGETAQVNDESLRDTLLDIANYAILAIMDLDNSK